MESIFNSANFSTKLTDSERTALDNAVYKLNPEFSGTKTDALKMILTQYFKLSELPDNTLEVQQENEMLKAETVFKGKLIDELRTIEKDLKTQLSIKTKVAEDLLNDAENKMDALKLNANALAIVLDADTYSEFRLIAHIAHKCQILEQESIVLLMKNILSDIQGLGYYVATSEELESAKIELGYE